MEQEAPPAHHPLLPPPPLISELEGKEGDVTDVTTSTIEHLIRFRKRKANAVRGTP